MDSDSRGTIQSETQRETYPPSNDQITDYPYLGVGSSPKESKKDSDINKDCSINVDARRARQQKFLHGNLDGRESSIISRRKLRKLKSP
ncbi:hypothetical protein AVEN_115546-1 [Araneus ventricosus]|uniref:Uncharacterized protein n=1 Tax=Araneus ventricosus TaxID=182803 RepID=A0A4Y2CIJ8_ARAVE|nr:hypothetical protein AVEN_115546-1 [Araneus ventricosus]